LVHKILRLDYRTNSAQKILSLDELHDFFSTCFKAEYSKFLGSAEMKNVELWLEGSMAADLVAADLPDTVTLAYMSGSKLLGTAVYAERQGYVYVWAMYVLPARKRSGIGSKLLAEIAASVTSDSRMEVSVIPQSTGAMSFYKKNGFSTYKSEESEVFPNVYLPIEVMQVTTKTIREMQR